MAITYFGYQDGVATSPSTSALIGFADAGYVCPGAGAQNLRELGVEYAQSQAGNVRMGLYDMANPGNLVVEADSVKTIDGAGWLTFISFTWHVGITLTGGATYRIGWCASGATYPYKTVDVPGDTWSYKFGDYTAGLPDPEPATLAAALEVNLRAGVEPAAGGSIIPILLSRRRRM